MKRKKVKLLIATPNLGFIPSEYFKAFLNIDRPKDWMYADTNRLVVHLARNQLCSIMLEHDFTHILFWDDDVIPPKDGIMRLLKHDKDIVMTPIRNRQVGFTMVYDDNGKHIPEGKGLQKAGCGSIGFTLVKREVVEKLFRMYEGYPFEFIERRNLPPHFPTGEDITFMMRARGADFEVWCDFDIRTEHLGEKSCLVYDPQKINVLED